MNNPTPPPDPKPYEKHACQGRYMEDGQPWSGEGGESLCMHCDLAQTCWQMKQDAQEKEAEA